jgi:antitoxin CptB
VSVSELNRLRWKSRRGMLELDAWLEGVVEAVYPTFGEAERLAFARMLDEEDPDLYEWMTGRGHVPDHYREVIRRIAQFKVKPS